MEENPSPNKENGKIDADEETVAVYLLENVIEAEMLENLLIANGIPCMIKRFFFDSALGKSVELTRGWGQLRVFYRDEKQARRILNEWQNSTPQGYEY